jgi:CubicO group peptidase (beta-lactamase class C family)
MPHFRFSLASLVLFLLALTSCEGRESAWAAADALIAAAVEEEMIPGAVLLVAKDGQVLYEKAYGYAQRYDYGKVKKSEPIYGFRSAL